MRFFLSASLALLMTTAWLGSTLQRLPGGQKLDPVVFEAINPPGLQFVINPGKTVRRHQPETMIAGIALFDYDNDGLLDVYLVSGASMPGLEKNDPSYFNRLFRHMPDGSFRDVTDTAGIRGHGYTLGVAAGDYDNDGFEDLFVAGLRKNILYHNNGDGTFTDVTVKAGLAKPDPQYGLSLIHISEPTRPY